MSKWTKNIDFLKCNLPFLWKHSNKIVFNLVLYLFLVLDTLYYYVLNSTTYNYYCYLFGYTMYCRARHSVCKTILISKFKKHVTPKRAGTVDKCIWTKSKQEVDVGEWMGFSVVRWTAQAPGTEAQVRWSWQHCAPQTTLARAAAHSGTSVCSGVSLFVVRTQALVLCLLVYVCFFNEFSVACDRLVTCLVILLLWAVFTTTFG